MRKAELVYHRKGENIKKQLDDNPERIGWLYKRNEEFLKNIGKWVYYGARKYGKKTLELNDLQQQAFLLFYGLVCEIPYGVKLREYTSKRIYGQLIDVNRRHFKETYVDYQILDVFHAMRKNK